MDRCNIFNADCKSGIVYVNGKVIDGVEIASQGQAASKGFMFLNGEKKVYFAVPIESLKEILDLLRELSGIVSSGVLPKNGGGDITAPDFASAMAALSEKAKALKEALQ